MLTSHHAQGLPAFCVEGPLSSSTASSEAWPSVHSVQQGRPSSLFSSIVLSTAPRASPVIPFVMCSLGAPGAYSGTGAPLGQGPHFLLLTGSLALTTAADRGRAPAQSLSLLIVLVSLSLCVKWGSQLLHGTVRRELRRTAHSQHSTPMSPAPTESGDTPPQRLRIRNAVCTASCTERSRHSTPSSAAPSLHPISTDVYTRSALLSPPFGLRVIPWGEFRSRSREDSGM